MAGALLAEPCQAEGRSRGGVPSVAATGKLTFDEAQDQLRTLTGWQLTHDGQRIRKDWVVKNFAAAVEFLHRVADLAEREEHHPDLHLEGYRRVWIEIWTHAIGGLSENDCILAAKIDGLPVELKR